MKDVNNKCNDAIKYFDEVFSHDEEDADNWSDSKHYVAQYGLEHEVFAMAKDKLGDSPTKQDCINAISDQMDEWDL